jgi:hypothetical protein
VRPVLNTRCRHESVHSSYGDSGSGRSPPNLSQQHTLVEVHQTRCRTFDAAASMSGGFVKVDPSPVEARNLIRTGASEHSHAVRATGACRCFWVPHQGFALINGEYLRDANFDVRLLDSEAGVLFDVAATPAVIEEGESLPRLPRGRMVAPFAPRTTLRYRPRQMANIHRLPPTRKQTEVTPQFRKIKGRRFAAVFASRTSSIASVSPFAGFLTCQFCRPIRMPDALQGQALRLNLVQDAITLAFEAADAAVHLRPAA